MLQVMEIKRDMSHLDGGGMSCLGGLDRFSPFLRCLALDDSGMSCLGDLDRLSSLLSRLHLHDCLHRLLRCRSWA